MEEEKEVIAIEDSPVKETGAMEIEENNTEKKVEGEKPAEGEATQEPQEKVKRSICKNIFQ